MASGLSHFAVQKLLNKMTGGTDFTPAATFYVSLWTVSPTQANSGGTEVSGGGYARKAVTNNTTNFPNISGTTRTMTYSGATVDFGVTTASWGNVIAVGWHDASTGGNLWWLTEFTQAQTIPSGADVYFNSGDATLTIN
jgi:hypothetical protein